MSELESPWDSPCDYVFHLDQLTGIVPCRVEKWEPEKIQAERPNGMPWVFVKARHSAHVFRTKLDAEKELLVRTEKRMVRAVGYAEKLGLEVDFLRRKIREMESPI